MKENNELERRDLAIDSEMEVDCDIGQEITVYIETWFDVDKKFGTQIADEDGTWLNLYGKYNPFADTLRLECEISRDNGSEYFDYMPTESEAKLIIILQAIISVHQCRQPIVTGFMIGTSCQPIHKHLLQLLSKRIQSVSKNSMTPARISIQINALPHLLNLI